MADTTDVAVVGAGVIGCAIAFELVSRGASVTLVDGRGPGQGATRASAGILSPYIEGHDQGVLLEIGVRSLALYDDFIRRVSAAAGRHVKFGRIGTLEVALSGEPTDHLESAAGRHRALGVRSTLLDGAGARAAEPRLGDGVAAALLVPDHAYVAAAELTAAMASAVTDDGGVLVAEAARRIVSEGSVMRVEASRSTVFARTVVMAAGSWSGAVAIDGVAPLPVRPVRGQLVELAWPGSPLSHITWGARCYMVPWSDGALLVGATMEEAGFDERTTAAGVRDLVDAACELVPGAWQAGFSGARAGLRPASPDGLPIIGRSAKMPGLVYATAHYRNGVLLAPLTAALVADLVLEGRDDPALGALDAARFGDY